MTLFLPQQTISSNYSGAHQDLSSSLPSFLPISKVVTKPQAVTTAATKKINWNEATPKFGIDWTAIFRLESAASVNN